MTIKDNNIDISVNKKSLLKSLEQDDKILDIKSFDKKKFEELESQKIDSKKLNKASKEQAFKVGMHAVYPSHGVGKISSIETVKVADQEFTCYLMSFEAEKLLIKIPVNQAKRIGLRSLSTKVEMEEVFTILRSGIKKLKGMWSRRAQEYETKINSGDIIMLAEVLRDLTRDIEDGERSYSERIIYETAIYRLSSEYAAIHNVLFEEAKNKVVSIAKDKIGSFDSKSQAHDNDFDDELDSSEDIDDNEDSFEDEEDDGRRRGKSTRK